MQSSAFVCRSCSRHLRRHLPTSAVRSISTTTSNGMPSSSSPYSPYYIDIPFPPQRYAVYQPKAKGKRPVPREIFPKKKGRGEKKITAEYLALVSKEPTKHSNPGKDAPETEKSYINWKAKMAASRRKNIREGLVELHVEQQKREQIIAERSERKQKLREALLAEDDPEDVKLTTPTILSALRSKAPLTDPDREERLAKMRQNYEEFQAKKLHNRREELHELYIRAHDFIFSERQLDSVINVQFSETSSAEVAQILPPDSRRFLSHAMKDMQEDNIMHLNDNTVIRQFADALTGGSQRDLSGRDALERGAEMTQDILKGNFSQTYYSHGASGMGAKRDKVDTSQKLAGDVFSVLPPGERE
ncbi:hypothetical protein ABW19_dt0200327 [Dactylella cylindrospora]|nr:hypothetical protein ABW19_dt0200327 [Dactylella cylindrospora]